MDEEEETLKQWHEHFSEYTSVWYIFIIVMVLASLAFSFAISRESDTDKIMMIFVGILSLSLLAYHLFTKNSMHTYYVQCKTCERKFSVDEKIHD